MSYNLISSYDRPDRFVDKTRGDQYHVKWGRYAIGAGWGSMHMEHLQQMKLNRNFFFDNQWVVEEDKEAFFLDGTNQSKNRIKVIKNFIKPIVMQYLGNSIVMDLTVRATGISPKAITRRENKLSEMLFYTDVANNSEGPFADHLRSKLPIGDSREETQQTFENTYKDDFVDGINYFMEYIARENNFARLKPILTFDMALTGIAYAEYMIYNHEFKWKRLLPEQVFFDRTAQEPDLSDCGFIGKYEELLPSEIFERWTNLSLPYKTAIEGESQRTGVSRNMGKINIYTVYWRDFEDYEYGYVTDEYDYPYLTRVNYTYDNEEKPRYTDKDLIPIKQLSEEQKKTLRGKNKAVIPVDTMRFIEFIPHEAVSVPADIYGNKLDIVLDYGIYPYQDTENQTVDNVKWPIKSFAWTYYKGFIDTPISSLINPQRMINRYAAVEQQQVASSHGTTLFYDESLVGGPEDEAKMLQNMYEGKPSKVATRGLGIHNMMGEYGSKIGNETLMYETLQDYMKKDLDRIVGTNDTMRGESHAPDKLVGMAQLEIQRSSIIQEPFYNAIKELFLQMYQSTANVGKRVYIDNKRKLAIAVGDNYSRILEMTEEYNAEDFRVFIQREPDIQKQREAGNTLLLQLKQVDMLDDVRISKLFNNATLDDIGKAMREYANEKMEMAKEQTKINEMSRAKEEVDMKAQQQQAVEMQDSSVAQDNASKEADRRSKEKQTAMKVVSNRQPQPQR